VVGLFRRKVAWSEHDDYIPVGPPEWARVVDIGTSV
jgi:hypothetical protein